MPDVPIDQLLKIDEKTYGRNFSDPEFGLGLANQVAQANNITENLIRITEGSSLVFSCGNRFLKLTPPFYGDSFSAELSATKLIGSQLPFPVPKVLADGAVETWQFLVTESVPGVAAKGVVKTMTPENLIQFAKDIGGVAKAFRSLSTPGFEREFGPWDKFLSMRLENQKSLHLARGNSEEWAEKIAHYVDHHKDLLAHLGPAKMIHADLNHEHLMMERRNDQWRVAGVIDLADAMNAPLEMELVLPILCFFRGNSHAQRELARAAGAESPLLFANYSNLMMALTLQNRFIAFHDWFAREVREGATSIDEVASAVFPSI